MPHHPIPITRALLASLFLLAATLTPAAAAQDADAPTVLDQQRFEMEGARMIGLSPDGRWLAAANFATTVLCVYDSATRAEQSCADLAPLEAGFRIEDARWSPDSTRLVFAEQGFVRFVDGDLWVMDAATGDLINITDDGFSGRLPYLDRETDGPVTAAIDQAPAWSPDGTEIAFSRSRMVNGDFAGNEIAVVPATGGEVEILAEVDPEEPGTAYWGTAWAPDGRSVYYSAIHLEAGNPDNGIYRVDRAGGEPERILENDPNPDFDAPAVLQLSPDGARMLVWYPRAAATMSSRGDGVVRLLDLATGDLTALEPPGPDAPDFAWVGFGPTFSPDGRFLLLTTRLTTPDNQVWAVDLNTGEATPLAQDLAQATPVAYGLTYSWATNGLILVPEAIGAATMLTVEGSTPPATPVAAASPPPATPSPEPVTTATVNDDGVRLRAAPSRDATAVLELDRGAPLEIIGPPVEADGLTWLPVRDPATQTIGYIRVELVDRSDG